jgi:hypothetical protein
MILFSKAVVRIRLDAHIKTIVVLIGGKLTRTYFLHLLYAIYFPVTTYLRPGKKVSIMPLGDVNPGLVPSRRGLPEDGSYRVVGVACPLCD